jgi:hypothetical protein
VRATPPAPPAEKSSVAADHLLEESDVGGVGEDVEADRNRDPDRVGVAEPAERVAEADQLREAEVDRAKQQQDKDDRLSKSPRSKYRQFGEAIAVRRVFLRHP